MKWKHKTWEQKKKFFRLAAGFFLIFVVISFFSTPIYEKEDLEKVSVTLTKDPYFAKTARTSRTSAKYSVIFYTTSGTFTLEGIDYKFLKHIPFRKQVKKGDELELGVLDASVLTIRKGKANYLQFDKAQFHKQKNRLFIRYLFIPLFLIALIPLFFKKQPKLRQNDGKIVTVDFGMILFCVFIIIVVLLLVTIGFDAVSDSEFID
jgi:hypothetical protein